MTRVLVAHASKRGSTAEIAEWVAVELRTRGLTVDVLPAESARDLGGYDAVVLGGALYAGRWPRQARRFVRRHRAALTHLPVWAFSSGPLDRSADKGDVPPPPPVAGLVERIGAREHVTFGGRLAPDTRGRLASKIAKQRGGDYRDRDRIREWAGAVAEQIQADPI